MKKLVFIISALCSLSTIAQVTYRVPAKEKITISYDSLENLPVTKMGSLIGQQIVILTSDKVFSPTQNRGVTNSLPIDSIFTIVSMFKPIDKSGLWIKLMQKGKTDTIYYFMSSIDYCPFIVLGFYMKQKQQYIGKNFTTQDNYDSYVDVNTGIVYVPKINELFTCIDATIIKNGAKRIPSLILKNEKGIEISVAMDSYGNSTVNSIGRFKMLN